MIKYFLFEKYLDFFFGGGGVVIYWIFRYFVFFIWEFILVCKLECPWVSWCQMHSPTSPACNHISPLPLIQNHWCHNFLNTKIQVKQILQMQKILRWVFWMLKPYFAINKILTFLMWSNDYVILSLPRVLWLHVICQFVGVITRSQSVYLYSL